MSAITPGRRGPFCTLKPQLQRARQPPGRTSESGSVSPSIPREAVKQAGLRGAVDHCGESEREAALAVANSPRRKPDGRAGSPPQGRSTGEPLFKALAADYHANDERLVGEEPIILGIISRSARGGFADGNRRGARLPASGTASIPRYRVGPRGSSEWLAAATFSTNRPETLLIDGHD